jgi:hypothetical protein
MFDSETSLFSWWSERLTTSHEVPGSIPGSQFPLNLASTTTTTTTNNNNNNTVVVVPPLLLLLQL